MPDQVVPITQLATTGVILDTPPVALPPNAFTNVRNVRFKDGAVRKMEGEVDLFAPMAGFFNINIGTVDAPILRYGEVQYLAWWPSPDQTIRDAGYYVFVVEERAVNNNITSTTHSVFAMLPGSTFPETPTVADQTSRAGNYHRIGLDYSTDGKWQHTLFNGGFTFIINNGVQRPQYVTSSESITAIDQLTLNDLPGWDSYLVNEVILSDTFETTSALAFDTGQLRVVGQTDYVVERTRAGATVRLYNMAVPATDPTGIASAFDVTQENGQDVITFATGILLVGDTISVRFQSTNPVNVAAAIIRSFGDFLVAGNLVERDSVPTVPGGDTFPIIRRLTGVVRSSDVAQPGSIPNNWNPFAAGASTADEFVIADTGTVQDMVALQGNFYLYTNSSISVMRLTGNPTVPLAVQPVTDQYGALTTDAVVEYDGKHFVIGSDDIYLFGGHPGSIQSISDAKVRRTFFQRINPINQNLVNLFTLRYAARDEIWICFPTVDSSRGESDEAYIWNYRNNTWTIRTLNSVISGDIAPVPGGGVPSAVITLNGDSGTDDVIRAGSQEVQTIDVAATAIVNAATASRSELQTFQTLAALPAPASTPRPIIAANAAELIQVEIGDDFYSGPNPAMQTYDIVFLSGFTVGDFTSGGARLILSYTDVASSDVSGDGTATIHANELGLTPGFVSEVDYINALVTYINTDNVPEFATWTASRVGPALRLTSTLPGIRSLGNGQVNNNPVSFTIFTNQATPVTDTGPFTDETRVFNDSFGDELFTVTRTGAAAPFVYAVTTARSTGFPASDDITQLAFISDGNTFSAPDPFNSTQSPFTFNSDSNSYAIRSIPPANFINLIRQTDSVPNSGEGTFATPVTEDGVTIARSTLTGGFTQNGTGTQTNEGVVVTVADSPTSRSFQVNNPNPYPIDFVSNSGVRFDNLLGTSATVNGPDSNVDEGWSWSSDPIDGTGAGSTTAGAVVTTDVSGVTVESTNTTIPESTQDTPGQTLTFIGGSFQSGGSVRPSVPTTDEDGNSLDGITVSGTFIPAGQTLSGQELEVVLGSPTSGSSNYISAFWQDVGNLSVRAGSQRGTYTLGNAQFNFQFGRLTQGTNNGYRGFTYNQGGGRVSMGWYVGSGATTRFQRYLSTNGTFSEVNGNAPQGALQSISSIRISGVNARTGAPAVPQESFTITNPHPFPVIFTRAGVATDVAAGSTIILPNLADAGIAWTISTPTTVQYQFAVTNNNVRPLVSGMLTHNSGNVNLAGLVPGATATTGFDVDDNASVTFVREIPQAAAAPTVVPIMYVLVTSGIGIFGTPQEAVRYRFSVNFTDTTTDISIPYQTPVNNDPAATTNLTNLGAETAFKTALDVDAFNRYFTIVDSATDPAIPAGAFRIQARAIPGTMFQSGVTGEGMINFPPHDAVSVAAEVDQQFGGNADLMVTSILRANSTGDEPVTVMISTGTRVPQADGTFLNVPASTHGITLQGNYPASAIGTGLINEQFRQVFRNDVDYTSLWDITAGDTQNPATIDLSSDNNGPHFNTVTSVTPVASGITPQFFDFTSTRTGLLAPDMPMYPTITLTPPIGEVGEPLEIMLTPTGTTNLTNLTIAEQIRTAFAFTDWTVQSAATPVVRSGTGVVGNQIKLVKTTPGPVMGGWTVSSINYGNTGATVPDNSADTTLGQLRPADFTRSTVVTNLDFRGNVAERSQQTRIIVSISNANAPVDGAGNRVQYLNFVLGTRGTYNPLDQTGAIGTRQSATQTLNAIQDGIRQANRRVTITSTGNTLTIIPSQFSELANFVIGLTINDSAENATLYNNLVSIAPNLGDNDLIDLTNNMGIQSTVPAIVTTTSDSQFVPGLRVPNFVDRNIDSTGLITSTSVINRVFDPLRPWPTTQVNLNREYPIFATAVLDNETGALDQNFRGGDLGFVYLGAAYESFVERIELALTPEFDTEQVQALALWLDGGTPLTFGGMVDQATIAISMYGSDNPGETQGLFTLPTSNSISNDFIVGMNYKVDMRIHGRFINFRISDMGSLNTVSWNLSGMQADIVKGGRR